MTTERNIISYCATSGAVYGCSSVTDGIVIIHGPRSCAHIMSSIKGISEIIRGSDKKEDMQSLRMVSTDMDDTVSVFGGAGLLEEKIRDLILEGHRTIFVVTSCVPGIIGDNTIDVVNAISIEYPDIYFRVVEADGNITGDWEEGFIAASDALLDIVDDSVEPVSDMINLLAERYYFRRGEEKDKDVLRLFESFGLKVNCRLMYGSSMDSVRNFRKGKISYIVDNDRCSLKIAELVKKRLNVPVDTEYLPVGIREYKAFSEKIGKEYNIQEKAAKIYADEERRYSGEIERIRPKLEGKKVLIENRFLHDIDWLIELLSDLGTDIVLIEMGPLHPWKEKGPESKYLSSGIKFKHDYDLNDLTADIEEYSPDIILSDGILREAENIFFAPYSNPGPGLNGVLNYGRRLRDLLYIPKTEGWRNIQ